ncbi:MAG: trypsin [Roseovarius sp.]|nr:trypsin [Roseovarius sp.]MBK43909.1 trypsin [Roseovarius sp.]
MTEKSKHRLWPALCMTTALVAAGIAAPESVIISRAEAASVQTGGYADLVERVAPAVVYVEVTKTLDEADIAASGQMPLPFSEDFARRFGLPFPGLPGQPDGQERRQAGVGAGFLISAGGDIVTNAHVVEGADEVTVTLADGTRLPAEIVGTDPTTDLALIRVTADHDLPHVSWGDSAALRVGEEVIAIGNPFGLGSTVTSGIVSALGRDINAGPLDDFIQTDAAINRGNSGGPLFDAEGRVVGVNTAIISPTGGSVGLGFAVPARTAQQVIADLADDGQVARGWLGGQIQPVTEDIAAALGMDSPGGVLIGDVGGQTPAAKAGLKRGDVVTQVGDSAVDSPRDLMRLVALSRPGTEVTLGILRAGQPRQIEVVLGNKADQPA